MNDTLNAQFMRDLSLAMKNEYPKTVTWASVVGPIRTRSATRTNLPVQSGGMLWREHQMLLSSRRPVCIKGRPLKWNILDEVHLHPNVGPAEKGNP